jgi:hypothetical protein
MTWAQANRFQQVALDQLQFSSAPGGAGDAVVAIPFGGIEAQGFLEPGKGFIKLALEEEDVAAGDFVAHLSCPFHRVSAQGLLNVPRGRQFGPIKWRKSLT